METSKAKGRFREVGMASLAVTCNRQYLPSRIYISFFQCPWSFYTSIKDSVALCTKNEFIVGSLCGPALSGKADGFSGRHQRNPI